ncbi:MAG: glutamine--fructose-6-phosphate transaminase (isomerizing) [Thermodesulfovibrionales bacterium]
MCGIVGYIGRRNAVGIVLDGLKKLEYRGYDSAGIAVICDGRLDVKRSEGKLHRLEGMLASEPLEGTVGIGHTRWATHGRPSERNAHPHVEKGVAVVHNGIIENHLALKEELIKEGAEFKSETDTEILAHLIVREMKKGLGFEEAVRESLRRVKGSYALAAICLACPDTIVAARKESPLILGLGKDEFFLASDIPAVLGHTREMVFLDDGEMAVVTASGVRTADLDGREVSKTPKHIQWSAAMAEKEGYKHFMLKEIFEQPRAFTDTIRGRVTEGGGVALEGVNLSEEALRRVGKIFLVACGTSWHACLVGKFLIEGLCRVPVEVDIASEFRYRDPIMDSSSLIIPISQSGETADTLAAVKESRAKGAHVLSICNVIESSMARESDSVIYTHAGPEIGVASTKAFTTQLGALVLFAVWLGRRLGTLPAAVADGLVRALVGIPSLMEHTLRSASSIERIAQKYFHLKDFLYLGRGINYPIALEGALKLKEISYIHAEGYPAGEMKHGPIALIDENVPVVVLAPSDSVYKKMSSNVQEVKARGGRVIAIVTEGDPEISSVADDVFEVPETLPALTPIILSLPLQLMAYHVAVLKGTDVDQPRNLAKSVTVE